MWIYQKHIICYRISRRVLEYRNATMYIRLSKLCYCSLTLHCFSIALEAILFVCWEAIFMANNFLYSCQGDANMMLRLYSMLVLLGNNAPLFLKDKKCLLHSRVVHITADVYNSLWITQSWRIEWKMSIAEQCGIEPATSHSWVLILGFFGWWPGHLVISKVFDIIPPTQWWPKEWPAIWSARSSAVARKSVDFVHEVMHKTFAFGFEHLSCLGQILSSPIILYCTIHLKELGFIMANSCAWLYSNSRTLGR